MGCNGKDTVGWMTKMLMNRYARLYVRDNNIEAFEAAGELMLIAADSSERRRLLYWWEEGVRDYARSPDATREFIEELKVKFPATF